MPPRAASRRTTPAPTSKDPRSWNTALPPRAGWSYPRTPHSVPRRTPRNHRRVRVIPRIPHAQRIENILAHKLFVAAPSDLPDQVPQQHISRIAIAPLLARREVQRLVPEARHLFGRRRRERLPFGVLRKTGEIRNPRSVRQQVINGDLVP